ncbi:unnamed protein product [Owenia fusiformis]|uniref:Uncharacterized protein n=1 Tax=Owenia fusiformis TaxID=6347 RepID=A0A8J1V0S8_OWEFU|nr:unnamed protein product [Owenia fusiformis]
MDPNHWNNYQQAYGRIPTSSVNRIEMPSLLEQTINQAHADLNALSGRSLPPVAHSIVGARLAPTINYAAHPLAMSQYLDTLNPGLKSVVSNQQPNYEPVSPRNDSQRSVGLDTSGKSPLFNTDPQTMRESTMEVKPWSVTPSPAQLGLLPADALTSPPYSGLSMGSGTSLEPPPAHSGSRPSPIQRNNYPAKPEPRPSYKNNLSNFTSQHNDPYLTKHENYSPTPSKNDTYVKSSPYSSLLPNSNKNSSNVYTNSSPENYQIRSPENYQIKSSENYPIKNDSSFRLPENFMPKAQEVYKPQEIYKASELYIRENVPRNNFEPENGGNNARNQAGSYRSEPLTNRIMSPNYQTSQVESTNSTSDVSKQNIEPFMSSNYEPISPHNHVSVPSRNYDTVRTTHSNPIRSTSLPLQQMSLQELADVSSIQEKIKNGCGVGVGGQIPQRRLSDMMNNIVTNSPLQQQQQSPMPVPSPQMSQMSSPSPLHSTTPASPLVQEPVKQQQQKRQRSRKKKTKESGPPTAVIQPSVFQPEPNSPLIQAPSSSMYEPNSTNTQPPMNSFGFVQPSPISQFQQSISDPTYQGIPPITSFSSDSIVMSGAVTPFGTPVELIQEGEATFSSYSQFVGNPNDVLGTSVIETQEAPSGSMMNMDNSLMSAWQKVNSKKNTRNQHENSYIPEPEIDEEFAHLTKDPEKEAENKKAVKNRWQGLVLKNTYPESQTSYNPCNNGHPQNSGDPHNPGNINIPPHEELKKSKPAVDPGFQSSFLNFLGGKKPETLSSASTNPTNSKPVLPKYIPELSNRPLRTTPLPDTSKPKPPKATPGDANNLKLKKGPPFPTQDNNKGLIVQERKPQKMVVSDRRPSNSKILSNKAKKMRTPSVTFSDSDNDDGNSNAKSFVKNVISDLDDQFKEASVISKGATKITIKMNRQLSKPSDSDDFSETIEYKPPRPKKSKKKKKRRVSSEEEELEMELRPDTPMSETLNDDYEDSLHDVDDDLPAIAVRPRSKRKAAEQAKLINKRKSYVEETLSDEEYVPSPVDVGADDDSDKDETWTPVGVETRRNISDDDDDEPKRKRGRASTSSPRGRRSHNTPSKPQHTMVEPMTPPGPQPEIVDEEDAVGVEDDGEFVHHYQKGDFVIERKDLTNYKKFPIWKLDTGRLLQKFEAEEQDGRLVHKSLSTYSSWTESQKGMFRPIKVKAITFLKGVEIVEVLERFKPKAPEERAENDPLMETFNVYTQVLLSQALEDSFLAAIQESGEDFYLEPLNGIDGLCQKAITKIEEGSGWIPAFKEAVRDRPCIKINPKQAAGEPCQATNDESQPVVKIVTLSGDTYDKATLDIRISGELPVEYMIGASTADVLMKYHSLQHFKWICHSECAKQIKDIQVANPELENEEVLDKCLNTRTWIYQLFLKLRGLIGKDAKIDTGPESANENGNEKNMDSKSDNSNDAGS